MKPLQKGRETGLVEIPANWFVNLIVNIFLTDSTSHFGKVP